MFVVLWEFEVKPGCEERFESIYSPTGAWAQLFRRDPNFRETLLLRDSSRPRSYVAVDFWQSQSSYNEFKQQHVLDYEKLDKDCESLTFAERPLGSFHQLS
jgi:heme-degrading monooxygenase HmoA